MIQYEGKVYRPPSEADSFILQATVGCSHNTCTYCDMYRDKKFRVREVDEIMADIATARDMYGAGVRKVFVADGDALIMDMDLWRVILSALNTAFPNLRRIICYATAMNLLGKSEADLMVLQEAGLTQLYIGPESGDDETMRRIAKGSGFAEHRDAAQRAHAAGMKLSAIFLLGAGGIERSAEHAEASGRLATAMDPKFVSLLTLTVVPGTPIARLEDAGRFELPDLNGLLTELRTFVQIANPTDAIFRTNHASNYLPLSGRLPRDREKIVKVLDAAIAGEIPMRPEWARGL